MHTQAVSYMNVPGPHGKIGPWRVLDVTGSCSADGSVEMFKCREGACSAVSHCQNRGDDNGMNGHTALVLLLVRDLELAWAIALYPTFDPSEPALQLPKEALGFVSCSAQHNHDDGMRKSRLWLQGRCTRKIGHRYPHVKRKKVRVVFKSVE